MRELYASAVRSVLAGQVVEKGNVRNTVLRQIKNLRKTIDLLDQGREIKSKEISDFKEKKPEKANGLEKQVGIIEAGIQHLKKAVKELDKYKDTSVT